MAKYLFKSNIFAQLSEIVEADSEKEVWNKIRNQKSFEIKQKALQVYPASIEIRKITIKGCFYIWLNVTGFDTHFSHIYAYCSFRYFFTLFLHLFCYLWGTINLMIIVIYSLNCLNSIFLWYRLLARFSMQIIVISWFWQM